MPEYLAPGVYVEEIDSGPRPIEGVSTSTMGFVGRCVRGSVTGPPRLVTSFADFQRQFGGYLPATSGTTRFLAHAVRGAFENGARRIYIKRVVNQDNSTVAAASDAVGAQSPVGGVVTRLRQTALNGANQVSLISLRGVQNGTQLTLAQNRDGIITTQAGLAVTAYNPGTGQVTLGAALTSDFDYRFTSVTLDIVGPPATPVVLAAADPGEWGNRITVQIYHTAQANAEVLSLAADGGGNFNVVRLSTTNNFYVGAIIEFDRGQNKEYSRVTAINGNSLSVTPDFTAATDLNPDGVIPTRARSCEFRILASYNGVSEDFTNLTLNDTTSNYYANVVNERSTLLSVPSTVVADNAATDPFTQPSAPSGLNVTLAGGSDGNAPNDADYVGTDSGPNLRTGIKAFSDIDEISIVAAPGITSQTVQNELITHCETLLDRFAILDGEYALNNALADIQNQRNLYDTKYAALYFPNLQTVDPLTGQPAILPPSGHMAGIYARTDIERGVHKAPANVVVRGITGLELLINKAEQDILNPNQINVIRDFRTDGRGIRVWGARCLTSENAWKYVPVRRLFNFVEESLQEGLQWVVFEPNDDTLWADVRQTITNFLVRVWRDGALMGTTQEEAFFVRCDRTTMTQDDIDNGRLIILVGIAPVKPAEFVIVRIQQYTAESNVE